MAVRFLPDFGTFLDIKQKKVVVRVVIFTTLFSHRNR